MAALAPFLSQGRQPLGRVDGKRLRSLNHTKNLQNAFPLPPSTPVKRPRPLEELPCIDSENIDPKEYSPSKKARTLDSGTKKSLAPSKFVLKQTEFIPVTTSSPVAGPTRLSIPPARSAPSTSAAGRSPKSKRFGILSRRRVSTSPFTRVDPPTFGPGTNVSNGLPFSIDAALSGTVPSIPRPVATSPPTLEEAVPHSWLFDIHEDTPEEELGNLVEFSTSTLDISDNESKTREQDHREKENIPPTGLPSDGSPATNNGAPGATTSSISRKDLMTDDPRTPLADLDTRDYYAEGFDDNSFIIVSDEKDQAEGDKSPFIFTTPAAKSQRTPSPVESVTGNQVWKEILAREVVLKEKATVTSVSEKPSKTNCELVQNGSTFEIWEAEGAKRNDEDLVPATGQR